jgi:hypothetical protein
MDEYFLVGEKKFVPDGHSVYQIIPKQMNDAVPGTWTVAVQPLFSEMKEGTKGTTELTQGWQNIVASIQSPEAYKVVQVQGGFWQNPPQVWPKVQNIGICGQFLTGVEVGKFWVKVDTNKLSDPPTATYVHEVYMINRENELRPIRPYPVRIILISENGYLFIRRDRLVKVES